MITSSSILTIPDECLTIITQGFETNKDLIRLALCCKALYQRVFLFAVPTIAQACNSYLNYCLNDESKYLALNNFLEQLSSNTNYDVPLHITFSQETQAQTALLAKIQERFTNIVEVTIKTSDMSLCLQAKMKILHLPPLKFSEENKNETLQCLENFQYPASVTELSFREGWISQKVLEQVSACCPSLKRLSLYECRMDSYVPLLTVQFPKSLSELHYNLDTARQSYDFQHMVIGGTLYPERLPSANSFLFSAVGNDILKMYLSRPQNVLVLQPQNIKKALERALEYSPENVEVLTCLGIFLLVGCQNHILQDIPRAQILFEQALSINPEQPLALTGLAVAIVLSKNRNEKSLAQAKAYVEKAATLSMDQVIWSLLGFALQQDPEMLLSETSAGLVVSSLNGFTPQSFREPDWSCVVKEHPKSLFAHMMHIVDVAVKTFGDKKPIKEKVKQLFKGNRQALAIFGNTLKGLLEKIDEPALYGERLFCHPAAFFSDTTQSARMGDLIESLL